MMPCHFMIGGQCFEMVWWFHHHGSECPMKNILSLENENTVLSQNVGHLLPGDETPHPRRRRRNWTPISYKALSWCPWCLSQLLPSSHWYIHTFIGKRKLLLCVYEADGKTVLVPCIYLRNCYYHDIEWCHVHKLYYGASREKENWHD
jgi:hypothetical protein